MTVESPLAPTRAVFHPDTYVEGVPYALFAKLRRTSPVVWVDEPAVDHLPPGPGYWAVLRYHDVAHVLRTPRVYSSHVGLTQIFDAPPPLLPKLRQQMINMDPPQHSRLRGLLNKAFSPRAVARIEARVQERADQLVAAVAERGACDFATDVVADLPLRTLADVLGVPESDRWLMYDWGNRVIGQLDAEYSSGPAVDTAGTTDMARRALQERPQPDEHGRMPHPFAPGGMADLYAYARELGEFKRRNPGDDVMSVLMQQIDGEDKRVSLQEFENIFWLLSVAGNETVRNALPGGLLALLQHPDEYRRVRENRQLLGTTVEEMLRWWTAVIHFRRTAVEESELSGVRIAAGQKVVVYFSSANRDEEVFDEPDRFDASRHPNPHLAFGHGPHFCIGGSLARQQMRAIMAAVLDKLGEVELAGEPVRLRSNFQNGIKHLPISWRPAR